MSDSNRGHGGERYTDEELEALGAMTDAKPDALEKLKDTIATVDAACRMGIPSAGQTWGAVSARIADACRAWEKERAERMLTVKGTSTMYMQLIERHDALRAAVEKVRDEMRGHVKAMHDQYGAPLENQIVGEWSDALDAALGGGA